MRTKRTAIVVVLIALLPFVVALLLRRARSSAGAGVTSVQSSTPNPPSTAPAPAVQESDLARELNAPSSDIRADLRVVSDVLEAFRSNFPRDGNPVGSNAEITAALTGKNK